MAQASVRRPFAERDLRHELRRHPVHAGFRRRRGIECRFAGLEPRETLLQRAQGKLVEARADLTRIAQRAATRLVHAEQQRTETRPRAGRVRVTDDDELLPLQTLHLQPTARALLAIWVVGALRDDAFEPEPAYLAQKDVAAFFDVLAVTEHIALPVEQRGQQRLPIAQRCAAQIPTVEVQ